jgi:predicted secreted protein
MAWVSWLAVYFIVWWTVLFAALPFGLRTQEEDRDVTLGTVASAPRGPHMRRAMLWTTIVAAAIVAALYFVTNVLGLGIDDIPRIVPNFAE